MSPYDTDAPVLASRVKVSVTVTGFQCHFQQYFSHIVAVSFIGWGNHSTGKKTTNLSHKSL